MRRFLALSVCLIVSATTGISAQDTTTVDPSGPLNEDEKIVHLLNRFTPGATPELVAEVREKGIGPWMEEQLAGNVAESDRFRTILGKFETVGLTEQELYDYREKVPGSASEKEKREARRHARIPMHETFAWVILRALHSNNHVRETSSDFFRNHFAINVDKNAIKLILPDWEREVILNNSLGKFGEILKASAKHPAMLMFLDNHISRRPPTKIELKKIEMKTRLKTKNKEDIQQAIDIALQRGLNENYARELLELHTLGVDRHYRQKDVIQVARILTGWTIQRGGPYPGGFLFNKEMHDPGNKHFLNGVIRENRLDPVGEGDFLLRILEQHKGTAGFLSWKLCRWLVNDEPDEKMVARIAKVFIKTKGDLAKVFEAIVEDPGFFTRENYRAKFKRPWEFVVSALRVTNAEVTDPTALLGSLREMNEDLYRCADPTGYYDQAEAWRDPGALAIRWTFAMNLAAGKIKGVRIPASFYEDLTQDNPGSWKKILVDKVLPVGGIGKRTSRKLDEIIETMPGRGKRKLRKARPFILAILLGSPEFQKQ